MPPSKMQCKNGAVLVDRDAFCDAGTRLSACVVYKDQFFRGADSIAVFGVGRPRKPSAPRAPVLSNRLQRLQDKQVLVDREPPLERRQFAFRDKGRQHRRLGQRGWVRREIRDHLWSLELTHKWRMITL